MSRRKRMLTRRRSRTRTKRRRRRRRRMPTMPRVPMTMPRILMKMRGWKRRRT